jgi:hypothetical protein
MNPYQIPNLRFSAVAGADLKQNRFVTIASTGKAAHASAGGAAIGASMNEPDNGQPLEIADGIVMVEASGTVTAGETVQSAADGKVATKTTGVGLGIAITTATTGNLATIKMLCVSGTDGADGADGNPDQALIITVEGLAAGVDIADRSVYVVPTGYSATVLSALVLSQGTPADIDDSNTCVVSLDNGSDNVATVTFDDTTAFPADGATEDLTLDVAALAAGDVVKLSVTNGATANPPAFTVQALIRLAAV